MERMSLLIIKKITLQITTRSKKEERKGRRVISRVKKKKKELQRSSRKYFNLQEKIN
jgi:hypothetical protein